MVSSFSRCISSTSFEKLIKLIQEIKFSFFQLLQDIKLFKKDFEVIYQGVLMPNPPRDVNMLNIYADRAKYLAMKPKKMILKRDMA